MQKVPARMYVARYKSAGNTTSVIQVAIGIHPNLATAQTAFFNWLATQPMYNHLWNLEVSFECFDIAA